MKWITKHEYVVLETGEVVETLPTGYYKVKRIQVKTKILHNAGKHSTRGQKTIVHAIRKAEREQQQLF